MSSYLITRLGHHGDGIAEGPVFAPLTLPGETVTGDLEGSRLTNIRVAEPSEHRVKAPCSHFKSCGGCQLQHASDSFVADWKTEVIRQALKAQGLEAELLPIHVSPEKSRRRATFSVRRTKKGALAGFHARASDVIVEVPNCQLVMPELMAALPAAAAMALAGGSRKGELNVTITDSAQGPDVLVDGGKPLDGPLRAELAALVHKFRLARLTWGDELVAMEQPPRQPFGAAHVVPPAGAFLQATRDGELALLNAVKRVVGKAGQVIDLFAGCGTFSLPLAEAAEVHAVEGESAMLEVLDNGWRMAQGLKKVTTETRDLFRNPYLPQELNRFDAIVLDPPRAGAEAQCAQICESTVKTIAYVSCNPVTFARDAAQLVQAGYGLDWVQPVDQFRWSAHTELAAQFSKSG